MRKLVHALWKFRYPLFALMLLGAVRAISQEPAPNLTGVWKWNPEKSHVSGRPAGNRRVKIEQQGPTLTLTLRTLTDVGDEFQKFRYTLGTEGIAGEVMGEPLKSQAQWKDGALAIESVARVEDSELRLRETWALSPDGQTLTYHVSRAMGDRPPREDTIVYEKQPGADWEPPLPPKPAEEVFKNIQVFKGMPATHLMDAMHSFSHSLGVRCDFCHVMGAFEKDDKEEKRTARHMILMARQINKDNFGGQMRVTCWTCHRGAEEPPSAPK
jgi:hypothetical protein